MVRSWERLELKLKTADLIGCDRRGTNRDDGFHRSYRREVEAALLRVVRIMRGAADELTRAVI
ncbi:MAG: hypothetical protein J0L85_07860 [Zoogloea sp.]|nr:hypothetical protein [Zoogloea sp.]MCA0186048.1 hypothetical protein [Pseudomonadota bacterium]